MMLLHEGSASDCQEVQNSEDIDELSALPEKIAVELRQLLGGWNSPRNLPIEWVVPLNETWDGELGLRFGPVIFLYFKMSCPCVIAAVEGEYRTINYKEFGDAIKPVRL